MIDWHCHILPGLDDGPDSMEESLAMARLLAAAGYTHVCCTPHRIRGMYETRAGQMREKLAALQDTLDREAVALTLVSGMEYHLDEFFIEDFDVEPVPLGTSKRVLVETPANAAPQLLRQNVFHLVRSGYEPLFAHPERHAFLAPPYRPPGSMLSRLQAWFVDQPAEDGERIAGTLLEELQRMGCSFQGNLGSVGGYYGALVRHQEARLREAGLYACYGSDGHAAASLEEFLEPALEQIRASAGNILSGRPDTFAS